jgi:hypothetical protein
MEQSTPDLLQEYENEIHLVPVGAGLRFVNFLIDYIIVVVMLSGVFIVIAASTFTEADINASASTDEMY